MLACLKRLLPSVLCADMGVLMPCINYKQCVTLHRSYTVTVAVFVTVFYPLCHGGSATRPRGSWLMQH